MRPRDKNELLNNADTFSNQVEDFLAEYTKYNVTNLQNLHEESINQNTSIKRAVVIINQ
jgi:hypothetical protein